MANHILAFAESRAGELRKVAQEATTAARTLANVAGGEAHVVIAGPPGTKARLDSLLEVFFPKSSGSKWKFPWRVQEIAVGTPETVLEHSIVTAEVIHQSGAPSTALRLSDGTKTFAYSGDTEWTDALLPIARDADLFICECYAYAGTITGHITWEALKPRLADLRAGRVMLTHMNPTMLAKVDDVRQSGALIAEDGMVLEF